MQNLRVIEKLRFDANAKAVSNPSIRKPPVWRRGLAEMIDRLVILPVAGIAYFFPAWIVAVFAWHLLRDSSPHWRSPGKALCRLRVIGVEDGEPVAGCVAGWRAALRRLGPAIAQAAWCVPELMLWALAYDLVSLAWILLSPTGRRVEDLVAGTEVVAGATVKRLTRRRERAKNEGGF